MSAHPDGPAVRWTGVVLAGGRSRRFGGLDKTRLPLGGRTLLALAVERLRAVTDACVVVGGTPTPGVVTLPDRYPGEGPLGGLLTALEALDTSHALLLAADVPRVPTALLTAVMTAGATAATVVVVDRDGRLAPCLAVRRDVRAALQARWDAGARRLREVEALTPCVTVSSETVAGPHALWNVNDPLTYARALEMTEHDCPAC